jgi:hypothetical protein
MVFSLKHDIKVTKNHQNLLLTQSVLVVHTVHVLVQNKIPSSHLFSTDDLDIFFK